jgi:quercetin dioxygenase-like cupin family protein
MEVHRSRAVRTTRLPDDWATGTGWLDRIIEAPAPARVHAVRLTFEPGARTAWHKHPLGQTLHVLLGVGRVQSRGGPLGAIVPGDTVWIAPNEEHWHGAAPETAMVHLAIYEADEDGSTTIWLEHVSDAEYRAPPRDR